MGNKPRRSGDSEEDPMGKGGVEGGTTDRREVSGNTDEKAEWEGAIREIGPKLGTRSDEAMKR